MRIVRLTNPEAFDRVEVQRLFTRAFEAHKIATFEDVAAELRVIALDPLVAILIGAEKGNLKGLSIACLPRSTLTPQPTVYHFFNKGSASLRGALIDATVDFFLQAGYTRFYGTNMTGMRDEVYMRLFRKAGEATRVGSVLEFKVG